MCWFSITRHLYVDSAFNILHLWRKTYHISFLCMTWLRYSNHIVWVIPEDSSAELGGVFFGLKVPSAISSSSESCSVKWIILLTCIKPSDPKGGHTSVPFGLNTAFPCCINKFAFGRNGLFGHTEVRCQAQLYTIYKCLHCFNSFN